MQLKINLQVVSDAKNIPTKTDFKRWIKAALPKTDQTIEVTVRIVDSEEIKSLNNYYRGKNKATNVLAFPFAVPKGIDSQLLGDLVICAPIVEKEAIKQNKFAQAHWAHLTIHGILHLLGYEHDTDKNAAIMETKEIACLQQLGFTNPYSAV